MKDGRDSPQLDRERKLFLGVCAGLAKYFDVPVFWMRVLTIFCLITWGLSIVIYLVMYFLMNQNKTTFNGISEDIRSSDISRRVGDFNFRKSIYRNPAKGKIKGVCAGIGDYFEINPFFVRLIFLVSLVFGPLAIFAYIVAVFLLDKAPNGGWDTVQNQYERPRGGHKHRSNNWHEDSESYAYSHSDYRGYNANLKANYSASLEEVDKTFSNLENKLRRLEAAITSKKFKIHTEFKKMS